MQYHGALLAVKDVKRSVAFYQKWFGLEIEVDLGWNVALKGGLSLQEHFAELLGLPEESVITQSHNMELYFECNDLEAFDRRLSKDPSVERVHPIREYPWRQRVIRIYDPDRHIIEVGESMRMVFERLMAEGHSLEETSRITEHPITFIRSQLEGSH
ncbi:MAG: glyoxalase/bleomycin resistance/dioxygenase family protein [Eubacteriales bacterium]|nr:glyoxalase/bleomycin resistance/dioxygenase family protein [Eubacteriales bacterium]